MASPQAQLEKALAALNNGDPAKAARLARKLTKIVPHAPDGWQLRAMAAQQLGEHADAATYLKRVLQIRPDDAAAFNNLGNAYREQAELEKAKDAYARSLVQRPDHVATIMNFGNVCHELEQFGEAIAAFRRALALAPEDYGALLNLGSAQLKAADLAGALVTYRRLAELGHDNPDVWTGIYHAAVGTHDLIQGEAAVERLLAVAGDDPKYHVYASILFLLTGRWRDGWKAYARRWEWLPDEAPPFPQPWWNGEDLKGRTLLVWGEQGIGDEIMYASMIPDLADAGCAIVLECDPRLVDLFREAMPGVTCVARGDPPDPATLVADVQIPSPALGQWLRTDEASFRGGPAFLAADAERAAALRRDYKSRFGPAPLVGVTWRSVNPEVGALKSMTLDTLRPVLQTPGVTFIDLQYGDSAGERDAFEQASGVILHRDAAIDPIRDINGHAAQVAAMDLIVSISNSTVHLAAAMGVPTWVMIQDIPNRRWLLDREDSPWYGSVRLFRQSASGTWDDPVSAVQRALAAFVAQAGGPSGLEVG